MSQSETIFSPEGLLAEYLDNFRYRPQQQDMRAWALWAAMKGLRQQALEKN